jgi:hypothetical protein
MNIGIKLDMRALVPWRSPRTAPIRSVAQSERRGELGDPPAGLRWLHETLRSPVGGDRARRGAAAGFTKSLGEHHGSAATPTDPRQRHRQLRRSGIDQDLVTIIDKALAVDPARRYPDASALVADLKAFKAGARIGARHYSLLALLVHRTRRHRGFAFSVMAMGALATVSAFGYLRNITAERDRVAQAFEQTTETRNALTLEHAELLLRSEGQAASLSAITPPTRSYPSV